MWTSQYGMAFANLAIYDRCLALARLNVKVLRVARKNLHTSCLKLLSIDEHSTTIVIALERIGNAILRILESRLLDLDVRCSCASLTGILKPLEGQTPTDTREESQFTITNNRHLGIVDLEFASCAAIVAASTEP